MSNPDLLLLLVTSLICSGTFGWNYLRTGASKNFGRAAQSWAFIGILTLAATVPLGCAVLLMLALQAPLGNIGRVLLLALLLQGQWIC